MIVVSGALLALVNLADAWRTNLISPLALKCLLVSVLIEQLDFTTNCSGVAVQFLPIAAWPGQWHTRRFAAFLHTNKLAPEHTHTRTDKSISCSD